MKSRKTRAQWCSLSAVFAAFTATAQAQNYPTKPINSMPGVPTAAEAGMPQLLIVNWFVLAAPAGTSRAIVERLNAEVTKVMQTTETQKHFVALGGDVAVTTPEQAGLFVREEYERWGRVIREANVKAE